MILEERGDLFQRHKEWHWIVIPTNGSVRGDGRCVMGRGLALAIARRYPEFSLKLGQSIKENGNEVYLWPDYRVITFPVKHNWWEEADLQLIDKSSGELVNCILRHLIDDKFTVYIPRVGCGNGKKSWETVKPLLEERLDLVENKVKFIYDGGKSDQ